MMDNSASVNGSSLNRFVKSIFLLLGIGILLPWNAFVSAKPYFEARLCSSSTNDSNNNVELWFGFIYNLASVLSLAGIILLQWCKDKRRYGTTQEESSALEATPVSSSAFDHDNKVHNENYWIIVIPLSAYLVVFMLTTVLVLIPSVPSRLFLWLTYIGLAVCGICTAFASAGIVGTAGMFPSHLGIHPYFSGQAVGGLLVSFANFAAALLEDPTPFQQAYCPETVDNARRILSLSSCAPYRQIDWESFTYFLLASIVLAACIVGYSYIDKYQRIMAHSSYEALANRAHIHDFDRGNIELQHHVEELSELDNNALVEPSCSKGCESEIDNRSSTVFAVLNAVKAPAFAVFMVYFVTLALFPGWTSQLKSIQECTSNVRLFNDLYTPLTFVVFNAADLAGRVLAGYVSVNDITNSKLLVLSLGRLVFFPLLLLCLARDSMLVAAIRSDFYSVLVQVAFGVGNGFVTTLCFVQAPTLVSCVAQTQTRASEILNLSLSLGLLSGSIFSFVVSRVGTGHW